LSAFLHIRATPRAARSGIGGWRVGVGGREELEVRVREAPSDGAANAAILRLLAERLRLAHSALEIVSGQNSRHKRIRVALEEEEMRRRLDI